MDNAKVESCNLYIFHIFFNLFHHSDIVLIAKSMNFSTILSDKLKVNAYQKCLHIDSHYSNKSVGQMPYTFNSNVHLTNRNNNKIHIVQIDSRNSSSGLLASYFIKKTRL